MDDVMQLIESAKALASASYADEVRVLLEKIEQKISESAEATLHRLFDEVGRNGEEYMVVTLTAVPGGYWDSAQVETFARLHDCSPNDEKRKPARQSFNGGGGTLAGAILGAVETLKVVRV